MGLAWVKVIVQSLLARAPCLNWNSCEALLPAQSELDRGPGFGSGAATNAGSSGAKACLVWALRGLWPLQANKVSVDMQACSQSQRTKEPVNSPWLGQVLM